MPTDDPLKQPAHDKLQALLDATNTAFDAAKTAKQRARLGKIADATSDALTALNRLDLQSRTGAFDAAEEPLQTAMSTLGTLKADLNAVSAGFAKAAQVVAAIDAAVGEVSSLFSA